MMILAIASVFAQTTPPQDQKTEPGKAPAEQAAKPPEPAKINVNVGWTSWDLSGNSHKFRQYATAPKGFFNRDLAYAPSTADGQHDAFIDLRSPWNDDYRLEGILRLNNGTTYIAAADF